MNDNFNQSTQNWDARQLIDSICGDFRKALQSQSHDPIEVLLLSVPNSVQTTLLTELIRIEIQHRRDQGESLQLSEYLERFPDHVECVRRQFQSLADTDKSAQVTPPSITASSISATSSIDRRTRILDRYQLLSRLGRGGFGEVWSAHDELLDRHVAIKFLRVERGYSDDLARMLLREGQRLAQLDHEHIVRVIDAGESQNQLYLISELMPGGTLEKLLHEGALSCEDAARWTITLAKALHHAHCRGIVHRDIKPSNILFDAAQEPHLADFGLAISEEELIGESPQTLGSIHYMPPEQARGESNLADPRSDVYSLGVVLYRMLTGRLPYAAKDAEEYRRELLNREPRPLRVIDSKIPQPLEAICLKCLNKSIALRPATAMELSEQLEEWLKSADIPKPLKTRKLPILAAVCLGIVAIGSLTYALWNRSNRNQGLPAAQEISLQPTFTNPESIAWMPYDIHDSFGYDKPGKRFRFDAFGHAVFRAAAHSPEAFTMKLDYGVARWEGWGGVIWCLNTTADGMQHCWVVRAGRYPKDDDFAVIIGEFAIGPSAAGRHGVLVTDNTAIIPAQQPAGGRAQLRVKADHQSVHQVWLNETELLTNPVALPKAGWANSKKSGTGFCGHLGNVSVYEFATVE